MIKRTFRTFTRTDLVFIFCLAVLLVCKFFLQRYQLFTLSSIDEVHPFLLMVFAAGCINLFAFFITALFSKAKREEWWELKQKWNIKNEILLNIWAKSLLISFVIFLAGIVATIVLFGSYYLIFLCFIVFTVQRYLQLKFPKA